VTQIPPIGLVPREIADQQRVLEILAAMRRFTEAYKPIPLTWLNELQEKIKVEPS